MLSELEFLLTCCLLFKWHVESFFLYRITIINGKKKEKEEGQYFLAPIPNTAKEMTSSAAKQSKAMHREC